MTREARIARLIEAIPTAHNAMLSALESTMGFKNE